MGQVSYRFLLVLLLFLESGTSLGGKNCEYQSNCGVILDIKPPFRFKHDSRNCGDHNYELSCENNRTVLEFSSSTLIVESIDYQQRRIHTSFPGLFKGNCSSYLKSSYEIFYGPFSLMSNLTYSPILILICRTPVRSPYYVNTTPCITAKDFPNPFVYSVEENLYSYAVIGNGLVASDIEDSCTVVYKWILSPMMLVLNSSNISFVDIHDQLASGIDFSYLIPSTGIFLITVRILTSVVVYGMLGRTLLGIIILITFVIYKFIFTSEHPNGSLSWERTVEIAVGVAQGISYLHHGCHMQILHFDIKPHNILLDDNLVPKVSDFGLAKLCPRQKNAVTLTAAKGTLGYMAPELMYRKIGEVSHKADVYSFGQLLMAMVGRKKVNSLAEHSSRVYFPAWIYERIERGEEEDLDLELGVLTKEEKELVRKIMLVALCCVQWIPTDRPSMREVVEMLEGDVEGLKLPSKPLYYFPEEERSDFHDSEDSTSALYNSTMSDYPTEYASY